MAMSQKDIWIARRALVKEGTIVDSGRRDLPHGQVIWILNKEFNEEQRQAILNGEVNEEQRQNIDAMPFSAAPPPPTVSLDAVAKTPSEVQSIAMSRLFGADRWFAYEDEISRLFNLITKTGLAELVPGKPDKWQATALGKQVGVDLLVIFLGIFDEFGAVEMLMDHGFIDGGEADRIWDLLFAGHDPEVVLKPIVRAAYRRHFEPCEQA